MAYTKPVLAALNLDSEACACNFFFRNTGSEFGSVGIQPGAGGELNPAQATHNNVANVDDNSIAVTPLANTGLPATQPIVFGVPVGVTGLHANVGPSGSATTFGLDSTQLGISILGHQVPLHL